jgi:hypothetical protein
MVSGYCGYRNDRKIALICLVVLELMKETGRHKEFLKETNYYELICGCIKVQGKCGRERNKFYL